MEPGSNGNKWVFYTPQNWNLTIRYSLVSYSGHCFFFPFFCGDGGCLIYWRCSWFILSPANRSEFYRFMIDYDVKVLIVRKKHNFWFYFVLYQHSLQFCLWRYFELSQEYIFIMLCYGMNQSCETINLHLDLATCLGKVG